MINKKTNMELMEKKLFIIEFNKGSQLDRSFGKNITRKNKEIFRKKLVNSTLYLMKLIDKNKLRNKDIRKKIYGLARIGGVSVGQAQKVINVSLKVYCFLKNKKLLKELDCPLDSTTMDGKHKMKEVDKKLYEYYQNKFKKEEKIRILRDIQYDLKRLDSFFKVK